MTDWFIRCSATYEIPGHEAGKQQCGFPALEPGSPWWMHDDGHETAAYEWGYREVAARKEELRNGPA